MSALRQVVVAAGWCLAVSGAELQQCVPMRWPRPDPTGLDLLAGTPINCLVGAPPAVAAEARRRGLTVVDDPAAVRVVSDSLWPRVKPLEGAAGPSGDPWLDHNSWRVRALTPPVWLAHQPDQPLPDDYPRAVADAALAGGRWIVALDPDLQDRLRSRQPDAVAVWWRLVEHLQFYEGNCSWTAPEDSHKSPFPGFPFARQSY